MIASMAGDIRYGGGEDEDRLVARLDSTLRARNAEVLDRLSRVEDAVRQRSSSGASKDKDVWTREEVARYLGVKPATVSKMVSAERKRLGRDPLWVQRLPGRERGFKVKMSVFERYQQEALRARRSTRNSNSV